MRELSAATARFSAAAINLKKTRDKNRIARQNLPALKAFFAKQQRMVLLRLQMIQSFYQPTGTRAMEAPPTDPLKRWDELWQGVTFDTNADLQKTISTIEREGLQSGADQLATQLKFDAKDTFSLSNPRAVSWFKKTGGSIDYIKDIQKTTGASLKRVVSTGLDEGWSYNQLSREIQKLYDGPISRDRAQRIAVFETGQSYEAGNRAFADSLTDDGVEMEQKWMTSEDAKVRPEHAANEAEGWVPLGHVFSSGDSEPPTDPGCRCYMIYRQGRKS